MKPSLFVLPLLLLGCCLFIYALAIPKYTSQAAADQLLTQRWVKGKTAYYEAEAKLRTSKTALLDVGSGLLVAAAVLLLFIRAKRIENVSDLKNLRSPNALVILLLANAAWLLMLPGTWWYYTLRLSRGDYPPFADSIGIPISYKSTTITWFFIPLNAFLLIGIVGSRLPNFLFQKPVFYVVPAVLWEVFFGLALLTNMTLLASFIADGDHVSILVFWILLYITLSLRAGRLN